MTRTIEIDRSYEQTAADVLTAVLCNISSHVLDLEVEEKTREEIRARLRRTVRRDDRPRDLYTSQISNSAELRSHDIPAR